ncbi:MAG: hypothetical protein HY691_09200 [Chloroflexi bacterium]|nr:hypothetical protein [Chloroflexota bacterium]
MVEIDVPGRGRLTLCHLVLDVNGTLACDGVLLPGVAARLATLSERLTLHLLTADTHGRQAAIDRELGLGAVQMRPGAPEDEQKAAYVRSLLLAGRYHPRSASAHSCMLRRVTLPPPAR